MKQSNSINHLSIILDGNKRWAKNNSLNVIDAYNAGINNVLKISYNLIEKKIKYLSVFALSTENIKRKSVNIIFDSIFNRFQDFLEKIISEKSIKIKVIGQRNNLPPKLKNLINETENKTLKNKKLTLILAFNYGFKSELISVFGQAFKDIKNNKLKNIEKINIDKYFYLKDIPDPDILIRTGNTKRLSNFLLWQIAYTEIFFEKKLWPEFNENDYTRIIKKFKKIKRNFGSIE